MPIKSREEQKELVAGLCSPDDSVQKAALVEVWACYRGRIMGQISKMVYIVEEREDVLSDVMVAIMERIDTVRNPEYFEAWLRRVVRNKCIDWLRKRRREVPVVDDEKLAQALRDAGYEKGVSAEESLELRDALARIPARNRRVIRQYYFEDLTQAEIAQMAGVSESTISRWRQEGLRCLRKILGE